MWDGVAQFAVWRLFLGEWLAQGWWPLWNPYQLGGYPLYANAQSAFLYPPNWLFAVLKAHGFALTAALHLWWAGAGCLLLLRPRCGRAAATLGGAVFMLSSWMVTWQYLPTLPATASWLPWVCLAVVAYMRFPSGRTASLLGLSAAMCLLAGHLQIAVYVLLTGMGAGLVMAWRLRCDLKSRLLWLPAVLVIASCVSAPQIVPTLDRSQRAHRTQGDLQQGWPAYQDSAMRAWQFGTLWYPDLFGHPAAPSLETPGVSTWFGRGNMAESACWVGLCALALALYGAVAARGAALWLGGLTAALCGLLLAGGTPLAGVLYFGIPGFGYTGSPARALVLWAFGASVLTALGAHKALCSRSRKLVFSAAAVAFSALVVPASVLQVVGLDALWIDTVMALAPALAPALGLLILMTAAAMIMHKRRFIAGALLLAVPVLELLSWDVTYNPPADSAWLERPEALTASLAELAPPGFRVLALQERWSIGRPPAAVLPPNLATLYGYDDLQGYDSLMPRSAKRLLETVNRRDPAPLENGNMMLGWTADAPRLRASGVRAVLSLRPLTEPGLTEVGKSDQIWLYRVEDAVGWVTDSLGETVGLTRIAPTRMTLQTDGGEYHLRMASEPGWRSDGNSVAVTPYGLRVDADAGPVAMRYDPPAWRLGLFALSIGIALITALWGTRPHKSQPV